VGVARKEFYVDPELPQWLGVKSRPHDPIVNFFWIGCRIPYGKGQKAKARKMVEILRGYSEEFAGLFDLEVEVDAKGL